MLNNGEASMGCLHVKDSSHSLQCSGNLSHEFSKSKNKSNVFSRQHVWEPERSLSSKFFAPPNEVYYRPMHQQGFHVLSAYHLPHIQKAQENEMHIPESHFHHMNNDYYFPMQTHFQHKPLVVSSQSFSKDFQFQNFQYFVVIDFEATCEKEKRPHPQEIIEFPSVIVNSMTGQLEDSFQLYVRPTCNQLLSDFCKELTGIQQVQVDKGVLLSEALLMHDKWLEEKGIKHTNFAVVTWSNWDCRIMLESECRFKRIRKPPYFNRWINLKVPFHEVFGGARCNLKEAVQLAGLAWEGRAHCGLDDAKNTARLLALLMHRGFRFSITNSLLRQAADGPFGALHSPNCPSSPTPRLPRSRLSSVDGDLAQQHHSYCYCGVRSYRQMVQRAGVEQGRFFFGCGNWTAAGGAVCPYFEWASP